VKWQAVLVVINLRILNYSPAQSPVSSSPLWMELLQTHLAPATKLSMCIWTTLWRHKRSQR